MRITKKQLSLLQDALSAARLERYSSKEKVSDGMRLYLDTWVVGRLETVIEGITGGGDSGSAAS